MEERVTYGEIRAWFLGSYYNYCRVKLNHQIPWVEGESEVGYAYSELENWRLQKLSATRLLD